MSFGTEHEYSINDAQFMPLPISDRILTEIGGSLKNEIPLGEVIVSKELQKHVLEVVPSKPAMEIHALESDLMTGLRRLLQFTSPRYLLMGLGMHPLLRLDMTGAWDHDEGEIYREYDRLFDIRQHGWLNIQALQINIPYHNEDDLIRLHNRIRSLLPFMVALTASSPVVEGIRTDRMDNRLFYYRKNQERIPEICHDILPEKLRSLGEYLQIQERIYSKLRASKADILCQEWLNSRGVIVRFSRECLEIKALDEQDCIRSDMAILSLLLPLLRCRDLEIEEDPEELMNLLETAIDRGTANLKQELGWLLRKAEAEANADELRYLPVIRKRIERGSLAESIDRQLQKGSPLGEILSGIACSLVTNRPFGLYQESRLRPQEH
ncbi:MAG: glutamate-cysteine ligase family protein [Methanomicrobiales archaeon]|nr:glutamate-cysteine ligase family protein [Methanomicrobiales archaeon]